MYWAKIEKNSKERVENIFSYKYETHTHAGM